MFSIKAYFWNTDVFIDEKNKYSANEILTEYLNSDYEAEASDLIYDLKALCNKLLVDYEMDYEYNINYNSNVNKATEIFCKINSVIRTLAPFDKCLSNTVKSLEDVLNSFSYVFENDSMENGDNEDSEYGFYEKESGLRLTRFVLPKPEKMDEDDIYARKDYSELNGEIKEYFNTYIDFLKSYITIKKVFTSFVKDYLNCESNFLSPQKIAKAFSDFNREHGLNFNSVKCKMRSFGYTTLKDKNGEQMLCEKIEFADLQSFIFYDFFNGIKRNFVPNVCKLCGRFFLVQGGKYLSYCDKPSSENPEKTCRDIGARRSYEEKCKTDPVWQAYNRAYKAHYARYMKKKMTVAEFEAWSRLACELRDSAAHDEIPYDTYLTQIRK